MKKNTTLLTALFTSGLLLATAGRASTGASDGKPVKAPEPGLPHRLLVSVRAAGVPFMSNYQGTLSAFMKNGRPSALVYCDTLDTNACRVYSPAKLKAGITAIDVKGAGVLLTIHSPRFGTDLISEVTVEFKASQGDWKVLNLRAGQVSGASPFLVQLHDAKNNRITEFNQLGLRVGFFPHIGMKSVSFGLNDKSVARFDSSQLETVDGPQ